ncbi:MAG: hypothetical protein E7016_02880 [Alphaproteobacteria bacterium]|nr:hypothetical protein [Alphaproteobacteria bacterium]
MDNFFALFEKYIIKSVPESQQNIILLYLRFAKLGIKSAQNEQISSDIRLKKFDLLYRQIFKPCALKNNLIAKLQQAFINENISLSLLSDMVTSFKKLVLKKDDNLHFMQLFTSLTARMIMVLNNLNMSVYMPFASLTMCAGLISFNDKNQLSKLYGFLKDAQILPMLIKYAKLRFKVCYFVKLLNVYIDKIKRKEPLNLTKIDLSKILVYALFKYFFTKVRTLNVKGV